MHFRTVLSGTLALLLVSSLPSLAASADSAARASDGGFTFHLPTLGIFGDKKKPEQAQVAQDNSGGMTGLEDQLRQGFLQRERSLFPRDGDLLVQMLQGVFADMLPCPISHDQ